MAQRELQEEQVPLALTYWVAVQLVVVQVGGLRLVFLQRVQVVAVAAHVAQ